MRRSFLLCLIFLPALVLAQTSDFEIASTTTPVQVVYVIHGSTLTTYNVNPQTLYATQVGALTLPQFSYPSLITTPNGRFLYYIAYDSTQQNKYLFVHATDASGAPKAPPVEQIKVNSLYGLPHIDAAGNFFYAVFSAHAGMQYTNYAIRRYLLNPTTGRIGYGQTEATYKLPSGAGGSEYCGLFIDGFNATGTKMYDEVNCGYHGGSAVTYNERTVKLQTGVLGPDQQVYGWNNSTEGGEYVQFVKDLVFDFVTPNNYQQGVNSLNIYPLQPNTSQPLLKCTAKMLEACGYAGGVAHPSGKYVFMGISQDSTQIDRVELSSKKIMDTSYYIPYRFGQFSPDGTMIYGVYDSNPGFFIEIFSFNVGTGALTEGGIIGVPSAFDSWFTAERY